MMLNACTYCGHSQAEHSRKITEDNPSHGSTEDVPWGSPVLVTHETACGKCFCSEFRSGLKALKSMIEEEIRNVKGI